MKSINKYLIKAEQAIHSSGIAENFSIPAAYKGAVASFGASLIMSGPIPTVQFYLSDSANRDSDHRKIMNAIAKIIYNPPNDHAEYLKQELLRVAHNRRELNALKKRMADAAIALKIMMRSYEFTK